jgi:predicted dehydrogenase
VEIQVHSIHYLDWIRAVLGQPRGVHARTMPHPQFPRLTSTRTAAILNYGDRTRCCLSINHNFPFGPRHQAATVRVEGTRGAAVGTLGVMLNYPHGEPDRLEVITEGTDWTEVPLGGDWFPDAFSGTMANLQRFAAGEDRVLLTGIEDAYRTMALVEACYQSDAGGGTPVEE